MLESARKLLDTHIRLGILTFEEYLQAGNVRGNNSQMHANLRPNLSIYISPSVILRVERFVDVDDSDNRKSTQRELQSKWKDHMCL